MLNLQYLDTRYALADVANLITHLRSVYGNVPVITHGYDHGGALAVWLRQRYPDLVDGVWASSASLHARKDFGEYLVNIGDSIRKVSGEHCYQRTQLAFDNMGALYDQGEYERLEEIFYLCHPITPNDHVVEAQLFAFYALAVSEILRYAHSYGVQLMCEFMEENEDPMLGLAEFAQLVFPTCIPLDGARGIDIYLDESWELSELTLGGRQLAYQYCREFGWFRSSSYINQPFGSRFPVELFQDQCAQVFGPIFNPSSILQMMDNTNRIFGGLTPNVTKVYFTDGDLDPAKTIGVLEPFAEEIYVDFIPSKRGVRPMRPVICNNILYFQTLQQVPRFLYQQQ